MNERTESSGRNHEARRIALALAAASALASCAGPRGEGPAEPEPQRDVDRILVGVSDPVMRERWEEADAAGELPPLDAVPTVDPDEAVAVRAVPGPELKEERQAARRPQLPEGTVADVQPFCTEPLQIYEGGVRVTGAGDGLVVAALDGRSAPLELHYALPGGEVLAVDEGERLRLGLRDEVVDAAQQRRVVLHDGEGNGPLLYLAEGSTAPFRTSVEELGLTIEQERGADTRRPAVRVSRGGESVVARPRERATLGSGAGALRVFVLDSVAAPAGALLLEGQPNYVRLLVYRPRQEGG